MRHDTDLACSIERLPALAHPALGLIAGVLAAMVIAAAAGRLQVQLSRSAVPVVRVVQQQTPVACQKPALPPEWRELSLCD